MNRFYMDEDSRIKFLNRLRDSNFMPCFDRRGIKEKGVLEKMSNEEILAEAISNLIDEEGPQFVPGLDNAIFKEYRDKFEITGNFCSIMRGRNSYYEKLGIIPRQLYRILSGVYPDEKVTSCRGAHSKSVILFKSEDSLKPFVDENFRHPTQGHSYWQYLPKSA